VNEFYTLLQAADVSVIYGLFVSLVITITRQAYHVALKQTTLSSLHSSLCETGPMSCPIQNSHCDLLTASAGAETHWTTDWQLYRHSRPKALQLLHHACLHTTWYLLQSHAVIMIRAHNFPRQILQNSAAPFAKFRGSPRQILGIPRLTVAAHYRLHCADFGPFIY